MTAPLLLRALLLCSMAALAPGAPALADDAGFAAALDGMEADGGGLTIYGDGDATLVAVPPDVFGRKLFWSAEVARYPSAALADAGSLIAANLVQLERRGSRVMIRSLSSGTVKTAGDPGHTGDDGKLRPVDIAIGGAELGPVLAALDIVAQKDDGTVLLDLSELFASDIGGYSALSQVATGAVTPTGFDPERSYLARAAAFDDNLYLLSHLTFDGEDADGAAEPVSIEVAHTLALLPGTPMAARPFDRRVGYFTADTLEFEGVDGTPTVARQSILRQRLERPEGARDGIVDPVEPLVYYLSPAIPERWRPFVRQGVEDWQGAFEAAGFSNAIVARDAPTPQEDPDWAEEDVEFNVIRWLAQPIDNAQGQQVHDPRSGEIVSAHILVWPEVLTFFADYYFATASGIDPEAATLPLSDALMGKLLRYVVAHEVGHTLGLRHNHKAATAYAVADLRDPDFVAANGTTASIMSYGRTDYIAQPGDGVGQVIPTLGDYDLFAIRWGYDRRLDADGLAALAAEQVDRPDLRWGAGEGLDEWPDRYDPTLQTEVIGAERIEGARLGIATLTASLDRLPQATRGMDDPAARIRGVYDTALGLQSGLLRGVAKVAGGVVGNASPGGQRGPAYTPVADADQRAAVLFVMGEGLASLDAYLDPELLAMFRPLGGLATVENVTRKIVSDAMDVDKLRMIEAARRLPGGGEFGLEAYFTAISDGLLEGVDDPDAMSTIRRVAIIEYLGLLTGVTEDEPADMDARDELLTEGIDPALAAFLSAGLTDTDADDWAQAQIDRLTELLGG